MYEGDLQMGEGVDRGGSGTWEWEVANVTKMCYKHIWGSKQTIKI